MAMKIRLARGGSKKRPHYSIVAADSRYARDGRFIEKLGTYDPLLPKDNENRVKIDLDRVKYWLGEGAQATDRVSRFLEAAGRGASRRRAATPSSGQPGKAAVERAKARADKAAAGRRPSSRRDSAVAAADLVLLGAIAGAYGRARRGAAEVVLRRTGGDRRLRAARHRGRAASFAVTLVRPLAGRLRGAALGRRRPARRPRRCAAPGSTRRATGCRRWPRRSSTTPT